MLIAYSLLLIAYCLLLTAKWASKGTFFSRDPQTKLRPDRVYGEIGPGERTALLKLAVCQKETLSRPLKIAIDVSIWSFQIQSGRGGTNADLRTLFYRLLRLLRLGIQPLFVFDGPHKPHFKRNKRTNVTGGSALNLVATELFELFGFPYINAPGEAEAECALLQREGIVDAALSEDVDTLMFGCAVHLRNWSSEGVKGKKAPTHVEVYRAEEIKKGKSGLDREGMVLVALMSGGDYIPAGIPGCGPKVACEAARAGFGHDLFKIDRKDTIGMRQWRERLEYELRCNESGYFRTRHKTLQIPENFPEKAVLYYYIHPVVSNKEQVQRYRSQIQWGHVDVAGLRHFSVRAFEWRGYAGLRHFVRVMAPALVGQRLAEGQGGCSAFDDMDTQAEEEEKVIKVILGKRHHITADNIPELRVAYIPKDIVGLDMEAELQVEQDIPQTHTAIYSSDEEAAGALSEEDGPRALSRSPSKRRNRSRYDPSKPEREWFPETYVKLGVPLTVENWEAEMRDPKKFASRKARARSKLRGGMAQGAIEPFLRVRKPGVHSRILEPLGSAFSPSKISYAASQSALPTAFLDDSQLSRRQGPESKQRAANIKSVRATNKAQECSNNATTQNYNLPSAMPAGHYSFRPTSNVEKPPSKVAKSKSKKSSRKRDQADTVVIVSSPQKHEDFPFEPSQRYHLAEMSSNSTQGLANQFLSSHDHKISASQSSPKSCYSDLPSPGHVVGAKTGQAEVLSAAKVALQRSGDRIILRQSLEGTWKATNDLESGYITPKRCFQGVEVLDLTAS